jgi:hypothetical protein
LFASITIWQVFEAERAKLVPINARFDGFRATQVSVSKTCLVRFDSNKYSVAARSIWASSPAPARPRAIAWSGAGAATTVSQTGSGSASRDPGLRRPHCHSPGRRHCRRAPCRFTQGEHLMIPGVGRYSTLITP